MWLSRAEAGLSPLPKTPLLFEKYLVMLIGSSGMALTAHVAPEHSDPQAHRRTEGGSELRDAQSCSSQALHPYGQHSPKTCTRSGLLLTQEGGITGMC